VLNYTDTTLLFQWIINSCYPLNILIYSGDSDALANFMGASNFVHALPITQTGNSRRVPWSFQKQNFLPMTVGFYETFQQGAINLDLLTVSSAGHMAPQDSPGPTLQMIANFMTPARNYSQSVPVSNNAQAAPSANPVPPALPSELWRRVLLIYTINCSVTRKQADKVNTLPGLTFPVFFNHYSGYLQGKDSDYLHYWLIESQGNPATDPLILW